MKNVILSCLALLLCTSLSFAQTLKVDAHLECYVAVINLDEVGGDTDAWWYAWHDIKSAEDYEKTPHTFKNLEPGNYVLVVYAPQSAEEGSGDEGDAWGLQGDGVVLEHLDIRKRSKIEYDFGPEDFVDWNCLSCPWLYAFDGEEYIRLTEVIQDVVGEENCQTTTHQIPTKFVQDGKLKLRIQEEKEETSYLDRVSLTIDGKKILPTKGELDKEDKDYLVLEKGEFVELEFDLGEHYSCNNEIILECNGFYLPKKEFLEAVYQKYLYKGN